MSTKKLLLLRFLEKKISYFESLKKIALIERNLKCIDGKIIGTGRPDYTRDSTLFRLNINGKDFALIDVPGIEGDESKFEQIIKKSFEKAHAIFYVNGSNKKIEEATLVKIKKYMHDGTSVYAIFNVHCKGKANRIEGLDKTYQEELEETYKKQQEIITQTEKELKAFLGVNFKHSILINGLLSFCANGIDPQTGFSTIINDESKNLRKSQKIYLRDYNNDIFLMKKQSNILEVTGVIEEQLEHFDELIYKENIKKLKNRLNEMILKIDFLKKEEHAKIKDFCNIYDTFESNFYSAKEDFIQTVNHIGNNAVEDEFELVKEELFAIIEKDKGKTKDWEFQQYFERKKDLISSNIQNRVNKKFEQAIADYSERIRDAQDRLLKDFERVEVKFEVSLQGNDLNLNTSFTEFLKYSAKDFGKHVFTTGSLTLSGAGVGTLILPGIGTIIGAGVGFLLGVLSSIWNYFSTEATRVNRAKSKLANILDEQVYEISSKLKQEIAKMNIDDKINTFYYDISEKVSQQKKMLNNVKLILESVSFELKKNNKTI